MNKRIVISIIVVAVVGAATYFFSRGSGEEDSNILVKAKKGEFLVEVNTTGELEAKSSVNIMGPSGMRKARIWEVELEDIIPEGTIVEKGDFVAQLDKSQLVDRIENERIELEQDQSDLTQQRMDTALELRSARDELINLKFSVEEKKLTLEQSQYEPPATIQKNKMELEKAKRSLQQAKENYELKQNKAVAQMQEERSRVMEQKRRLDYLEELRSEFRINAPEPGMLIYARRRGNKVQKGSQIQAWDPIVATLPDLTRMISKTYINEVDIRKISKGQQVRIGLDAYPDKKLTGEVVELANVGQQSPNSDAKVFEVIIDINEKDTTLRPAMTTSNSIIVERFEEAVFLPLEAVHSQGDSVNFVVKPSGMGYEKQQVITGTYNENEIIIKSGIKPNETVLLNMPEEIDELSITMLPEEETRKLAENQ